MELNLLAVIVGGGRGLGAVLAKHLFLQGYSIALVSRTLSDLESVRSDLLRSKPNECVPAISIHAFDVSDRLEAETCFAEIAAHHPQNIRLLVNCAATWTGSMGVLDMPAAYIEDSMKLNLFSAVNAVQQVLRQWKAQRQGLAIINIGATASLRGSKNCAAFAAAKSALRTYSQSLAKELANEGVHVAHLIVDGLIDNKRTRTLNPDAHDNKYISPDSIAKEILHVVSQARDCWTFEWDIRTSTCVW